MENKFSIEELNQILLSKKLEDFYIGIIADREELSNEKVEELSKIDFSLRLEGMSEKKCNKLIKKIEKFKDKEISEILKKIIISVCELKHFCIITLIGDGIYNDSTGKFVNLNKQKIVHFEKLTNYFNEKNAKIRYFSPKEDSKFIQDTISIELDEKLFHKYAMEHTLEKFDNDLTEKFIAETKSKQRVLK